MSVIGPSCQLPSKDSPGCACTAPKQTGTGVAATASVTALAAIACTACCLLPFTLPATLFALAGGSIAVLDHAHGWVTRLSIAFVIAAWLRLAWQRRKAGRPVARRTIALTVAASLLTAAAASSPLLEPAVFKTMGIVKKTAGSQSR
jgi:hypothetical protein